MEETISAAGRFAGTSVLVAFSVTTIVRRSSALPAITPSTVSLGYYGGVASFSHAELPDPRQNSSELILGAHAGHHRDMLELLIVVGRALALGLRGDRELVLENLALRQQLMAMKRATKRPHLQGRDRLFWIALRRIWKNWRTGVVFVRPDTVVRWHRDWLRRRWTRRSTPRANGRPPVTREIRALVREMATANPLWGAPRIHGELRTLGVDVSERTVSRLLKRRARPPSQTWRTFLNHIPSAASIDFFTVPTLTGRVLFVLVVLSHARRRILHANITAHPTAEWTAQQVVDAFPGDTAPRWIHRDRDRIYGAVWASARTAGRSS